MPTNKPETTPGGENLLAALISCTTAAAFSATCTYPFDFIKTQQQLNNEKVMKNGISWKLPQFACTII